MTALFWKGFGRVSPRDHWRTTERQEPSTRSPLTKDQELQGMPRQLSQGTPGLERPDTGARQAAVYSPERMLSLSRTRWRSPRRGPARRRQGWHGPPSPPQPGSNAVDSLRTPSLFRGPGSRENMVLVIITLQQQSQSRKATENYTPKPKVSTLMYVYQQGEKYHLQGQHNSYFIPEY